MKYARTTIQRAAEELKNRRRKAEAEAEKRRSLLFMKSPEAAKLERQIASASSQFAAIMALRDREKIAQKIEVLKQQNLALQKQLEQVLLSLGLPRDYLEVHYQCDKCNDTGSRWGQMCPCFEKLLRQTAFQELCESSPLEVCSFADFDLSYYPENDGDPSSRTVMKSILDYCKCYAEDFSEESPNICMFGSTGLGKTHLSLAIAAEVIAKGYGVVYGSCPNLLSRLEREKFGRSNENTEESLLDCDLLILDDLGAEFSTQFTVSAIYNIINTRLLKRLPTIISTNLGIEGIQQKYTERVASRLIGEYTLLRFTGKDVRQLKNS